MIRQHDGSQKISSQHHFSKQQDKEDHLRDMDAMEQANTYSAESVWKPDMYISASIGMTSTEYEEFINACLYE